MGLDMYMNRRLKTDVNGEYAKEVAYWRKANQVRQWIVDHTEMQKEDNCEIIPMTKELLEQLVKDCEEVLANPERASEIMPTSSGFFFGGTEYDEWYFENLRDTIQQVKEILDHTDFDTEVVEYTEWW